MKADREADLPKGAPESDWTNTLLLQNELF